MNLKKKFVVGAASAALIAGMGLTPAFAVDDPHILPGMGAVNAGRLAGVDRIGTSMEVARHEFTSIDKGGNGTKASVAYIVNYQAMVDAATSGMLTDGPIILVDNNRRTAGIVGKFLKNHNEAEGGVSGFKGIRTIIAVGGTSVVSDETLKVVAEAAGVAGQGRLDGADRYQTSVAVANRILTQAMKSEKAANNNQQRVFINPNGNRLGKVYLANGADSHVVDAMAAGVLDDGPILYVNPDGTIPESVAEFIKKTLPMQWGVLGGTSAVSDETASAARAIAVYKNDWTEAYDVPALRKKVSQLKTQVNGSGSSRLATSSLFMGYNATLAEANALFGLWNASYSKAVADVSSKINTVLKSGTRVKPTALQESDFGITSELTKVYGTFADSFDKYKFYFTTDDEGWVNGFDFEKFESIELKKTIGDAKADLDRVWGMETQNYQQLKDAVAKATQDETGPYDNTSQTGVKNSATETPDNDDSMPVAAVRAVSQYVRDGQRTLLDNAKKELAEAQNKLAVAENKIRFTVEGRLGGSDRYATAAAVAQYWADDTAHVFDDVYVADGHALADALVAGQLTRGPLLLVASGKEVPAATKSVAGALTGWANKTGRDKKIVYGVGGKSVLEDATLTDVYKTINAAAKGEGSGKTANKLAVDKANSHLNVITTTQDGTAVFTWDGLAASDMAQNNIMCKNATATGVTLGTGACTFSGTGIKIDRSKVTLANANQPGTITVPVEYRGELIKVTFMVYSGESAGIEPTTDNAISSVNFHGFTGTKDYELEITTPAADVAKTAKVDKIETSNSKGKVTAKFNADNKLVLTVTADQSWTTGDTITVTATNTEPGKAPKTTNIVFTML